MIGLSTMETLDTYALTCANSSCVKLFFFKLFITKENIDETSKLAQPRYRDLHDIVLG